MIITKEERGVTIRVMLIDAGVRDLESSGGKLVRPSQRSSITVVCAMNVVLIQDLLTIGRTHSGKRSWR